MCRTGGRRRCRCRPPRGANVGFALYHAGLPVNDFRYLSREEIVDLDWDDPWFSRFRNRNLWRRFDSPVNVFLYVDYFEIRKEIVLRPRDLERMGVDLGLAAKDVIGVSEQEALKRKVAAFLGEHGPVTVDGAPAEFALERIHFIRRSLRMTGVIDPPEELPVISATLGVIFTHPRTGELPRNVTMRWDLFSERVAKVPATGKSGIVRM